jgi:hypothetical protein
MEKMFFVPTVTLRCGKCNNKTQHALVEYLEESNSGKDAVTLNYECQDCSEKKKIFVFVTCKIS